ncbi:MAG TPA: DNA methyltransferase [Gemmata sp.]|jgi:adenine-specific DNA-methyltransferase|nr:DNA methyltransferase [Gemmata sp.]
MSFWCKMNNIELPLDNIYLGDCRKLLSDLPNGCVDLVVSSPPYNLGKEYEAKRGLEIYLTEQKEILKQCARILAPTGSLFWQVGAFADEGMLIPLDIRFFPIIEACGMIPRNRIIWARQHGLHATRKFSCRHETILWFTKSDKWIFNMDAIRVPQKYQNKTFHKGDRHGELSCHPDGKNPGDIWLFRNVKHNHEEQTIHPCQFPEDLITRILLATTSENQVVFDPFMGAGTVAVVARNQNRRFMGAELDSRYHSVAIRRLKGEPDDTGCFPNLKTLRDYCERTGRSVEEFRFDVQVGANATPRTSAKIYPEEHHLKELEERLLYEEAAFAADVRGEERPVDIKLNGGQKSTQKRKRGQTKKQHMSRNLFDNE